MVFCIFSTPKFLSAFLLFFTVLSFSQFRKLRTLFFDYLLHSFITSSTFLGLLGTVLAGNQCKIRSTVPWRTQPTRPLRDKDNALYSHGRDRVAVPPRRDLALEVPAPTQAFANRRCLPVRTGPAPGRRTCRGCHQSSVGGAWRGELRPWRRSRRLRPG